MKASAIYREAARIIAEGECRDTIPGACSAIGDATYPELTTYEAFDRARSMRDEIKVFEELFAPSESSRAYWGDEWATALSDVKHCRTLALCFMSAISELEGN